MIWGSIFQSQEINIVYWGQIYLKVGGTDNKSVKCLKESLKARELVNITIINLQTN